MIFRTMWTRISPMEWDNVIGKAGSSDYEMDDLIR